MDGRSHGLRGKLASRCVLVETESELVLVDTGFGLEDIAHPKKRLSAFFLRMLDPDFREELTAVRQIEALGFSASDVRHIVLTHLDFDHAGGLDDFPEATVHMLHSEAEDAVAQQSWLDRQRYRPQQWRSYPRWTSYNDAGGERWFGFDAVRDLRGIPPEILLVPLRGHTLGHAGVAMRDREHWFLLAGDAYFDRRELDFENPRCTPGLAMYQRMMEKDREMRLANQQRLRELAHDHGRDVRIICSHDPHEIERDTGRTLDEPVHSPLPNPNAIDPFAADVERDLRHRDLR